MQPIILSTVASLVGVTSALAVANPSAKPAAAVEADPVVIYMTDAVVDSAVESAVSSELGDQPIFIYDIITPLPQSADDRELRFQPDLDYDSDGCYNTAAISPDGTTNPGKAATGTPQGQCRDKIQLDNSNAYSRRRCNNGVCATMYEYYFEKDQALGGSFLGGHRHDWENIIVFTRGDAIFRVAPSCHGDYEHASNSFPTKDGHPLLVYHKDGIATHCFRFANDEDQGTIENPTGGWFRSPLVGWNSWPSVSLRDKMLQTWSGGVGPKLDSEYGDCLKNALGDVAPEFDPYTDE